jgi:hypothetical protein
MLNAIWAALAAILAGVPVMTSDQPRPVHLQVSEDADSVELIVTASDGGQTAANFKLEFESIGLGGRTKTAQSGTNARQAPGGVLLRSRVKTSGLTGWNARLSVESGGHAYEELRMSAR